MSGEAKAPSGNKPGTLAKQLQATLQSTRQIVANFNAVRAKHSGRDSAKKT